MGDAKKGVIQTLVRSGWERKLRNAVYKCLQTYNPAPHLAASPDQIKEPNSYIRRAQVTATAYCFDKFVVVVVRHHEYLM